MDDSFVVVWLFECSEAVAGLFELMYQPKEALLEKCAADEYTIQVIVGTEKDFSPNLISGK